MFFIYPCFAGITDLGRIMWIRLILGGVCQRSAHTVNRAPNEQSSNPFITYVPGLNVCCVRTTTTRHGFCGSYRATTSKPTPSEC